MSHLPHCVVIWCAWIGNVISKRKINLDVTTQLSFTCLKKSDFTCLPWTGIFSYVFHKWARSPFSALDANRVTKQATGSFEGISRFMTEIGLHFMVPNTDKCHIPVLNRWIQKKEKMAGCPSLLWPCMSLCVYVTFSLSIHSLTDT